MIVLSISSSIALKLFCLSVPAVLPNTFQADATAYFGSVLSNATSGTVVINFRIIIDRYQFTNNDLGAILIIMNRNNLVESIFKFSDGANQRRFAISNQGGIVAVNASRVFPEIRLLNDQYILYEDHIIFTADQDSLSTLEFPVTLHFDLSLLVVGINPVESIQHRFARANVTILSLPGIS